MDRKLKECETCPYWDKEKNKMKNKLRCMVQCNIRIKHQTKMAIVFNRNIGSKHGEFEHGKEVL